MHNPAQRFLSLRALGAPAVVVSLALQGVFRGFKDTKTPVLCLGKCLVNPKWENNVEEQYSVGIYWCRC